MTERTTVVCKRSKQKTTKELELLLFVNQVLITFKMTKKIICNDKIRCIIENFL